MSVDFKPHPLLEGVLSDEILNLVEKLQAVLDKPLVPQATWIPETLDGPWSGEWVVAAIPEELRTRRVELVVCASDVQGIAEGLDSGAGMVLDFDDTFSPTWNNVAQAYANLCKLKQLEVSREKEPILVLRPRPLYLSENHLRVGGRAAIAGLVDLSVYLVYRRGGGLYIYLPKLESIEEAETWDALLNQAEQGLNLPPNAIRVGIQIETLPAAFQAEALLYTLKHRAFGLNAGRWDYVFSLVKKLGKEQHYVLPEREHIGMNQAFLQAYEQVIVQICHKHQAQAIGGSAALVPENPQAMQRVAADKAREANQGFHAAWAGHPALVETVRSAFVGNRVKPLVDSRMDLTEIEPARTLEPVLVHDTLDLALSYLASWLQGQGVLNRKGRIEDVATAELARAQLWQWVYHQMPLTGGGCLDAATYKHWKDAELEKLSQSTAGLAGQLLDQLVLTPWCPSYFTLLAYPYLTRLEASVHL